MVQAVAQLYAAHIEARMGQIETLMEQQGLDALLIHSGRPEYRLFDDQHPPFRAHAAFVALVPQAFGADSLLEIRPGHTPRLWHCQPDDFWHMPPEPPPSWLSDSVEVRVVESAEGWKDCFGQQRATAVIGQARSLGDLLQGAELNPPALVAGLHEMRTRKTAWEQHALHQANRLAAAGHLAAGEAFAGGASELEAHLAYLAAARQDQDALPYNSIVALNDHGAVLHYQFRSPQRPPEALSLLVDAGADWRGYAADITRTWARAGHQDFADLVSAMDEMQLGLVAALREGLDFVELHLQAHHGVATVLEQAGLVRMPAAEQVETGVSAHFLPHGLGHFIGVQVHDVAGLVDAQGRAMPPPERYAALRLTRQLEAGNVVTIEPGLYFIPQFLEALAAGPHADRINWPGIEALRPYGGIRIEDNVLVTQSEPVNYTRQAFAEVGQKA